METLMLLFDLTSDVPPGWIGGFAESNPKFAYPEPDLTSLPMLCNMDNIRRIKRQLPVWWPEFSWLTIPGDESSRCFQRFAHNISSIGYDNRGRIWSIICPQQGICAKNLGCLNVEVTVTGQRGWVNEEPKPEKIKKIIAADMTVEGKIWFSPSSHQKPLVKLLWDLFESNNLPFPSDKANAIQVHTHLPGNPEQPIFPILAGLSPLFNPPPFAQHSNAWASGYIEVEIGDVVPTGNELVDTFNKDILKIFNLGSGNMLLTGNVLTWNLWFLSPKLVNTERWITHAERWRKSIDADHGIHQSGEARYADGTEFSAGENFVEEVEHKIKEEIEQVVKKIEHHFL